MISSLLINEHPLQVLPSLAERIGLNEAIVLQQIHYWINPNQNKNIFENRHWVYNTYEQWQKQFPFWSKTTIRRTISRLEDMGVVISRDTKGIVKYYTVNYEILSDLQKNNPEISECQNEQGGGLLKLDRPPAQIGQTPCSNWTDPLLKLDTLYIDTENTQRIHREREAHSQNAPCSNSEIKKEESKRGTRLPHNWELPDEWREWLLAHGVFNEQIDIEAEKFKNYWVSTTKNPTKVNWFMTWKNWCYSTMERSGKHIKILRPKTSVQNQETSDSKKQELPRTSSMIAKKSDNPTIQRWYDLQPRLKELMGDNNYRSWIEGSNLELVKVVESPSVKIGDSPITYVGKGAVFKVRNQFMADWINSNHRGKIAQILSNIDSSLGDEYKIEFIVDN